MKPEDERLLEALSLASFIPESDLRRRGGSRERYNRVRKERNRVRRLNNIRKGCDERVTELLRLSYEDDVAIPFPIPLKGENTVTRNGTPSNVDRNVSLVINVLRKMARKLGYRVRTKVYVSPDDGLAYLTFKVDKPCRLIT